MSRVRIRLVFVLFVTLMIPRGVGAQPAEGTVLRSVTLTGGDSFTVGFDGTYLYWIDDDDGAILHKIDTFGVSQGDIPMADCNPFSSGTTISISWDPTRNVFWGAAFGVVTQITTTGACQDWFDVDAAVGGTREDFVGLAYDPSDDSIWYRPKILGNEVFHFAIPPAPIAGYVAHPGLPSFVAAPTPCPTSQVLGVATGADPTVLYLSACGHVLVYDKTNGNELGFFPISPAVPSTQDIECDPVTFAGQGTDALWVADQSSPVFELHAVAVAQGSCANALPALPVPMDYKPAVCPNVLKTKKQGEFIAILGTSTFDASQVDPATVRVEGVAPISSFLFDVAEPFVPFTGKTGLQDCNPAGPDGFTDLIMRYNNTALAAALGPVSDGEIRVIRLTGNLLAAFGGGSIVGEDVVELSVPKPK